MRPAPVIVVAGPSGVGKSTVVDAVVAACPLPVRRAVTATTRPPRPGEVPEVDYHYWTPEEFRQAEDAGLMLETAVVFGRDRYGTPASEVEGPRRAGKCVILVIDVQGAASVRAKMRTEQVSVFLAPPGLDELRARLVRRGSESIERVERRLATAFAELERENEFDVKVVNGVLADAAGEIITIIRDQFALREALAMLDDLKEEEIVNKVGGRFKLSTLIQKRMVALNTGAKPLVDLKSPDKMAIVLEEILQDKIYLDQTGEVQTSNMTVSMNLPSPYFGGGGTNSPPAPLTPQATDDDD